MTEPDRKFLKCEGGFTLRRCRICGIPETVDRVKLDEDGVCKACRQQIQHIPSKKELREEVRKALENSERVLVTVSGGLDSLAALGLALRICDEVVALTVDTGALHPEAWRRIILARRKSGVEWEIIGDQEPFLRLFEEKLTRSESPCGPCSRMIARRYERKARELGVDAVVTGHELPHGTSPVVPKNPPVIRAMCGMTENERREIVKEEFGLKVNKISGYTSNCVVLPFALKLFYIKYGYSFEAPRLAAMVRYGYISREDTEQIMSPPTLLDLKELLRECKGWIPKSLEQVLQKVVNKISNLDPGRENGG
ncbi:phosphoadenosine phosphosulfate reductase domain-containing protein [Methanopyrus sp.]